MNINVHFEQCNIIYYSVFVRYYADPNMKSDVILIDHRPKIPRCTIASKVYLKILEFFKFDDVKWKIINFDRVGFFRYDCDFEILFETRKNWILVRGLILINYIITLKRSSSLINFNYDSNVKLPKIIMLLNKYIDTYSLFKNLKIRLN